MNYTQNEKIEQVTDTTMVVMVDQAYRPCFIYNSCLQACQGQAVSRLSF